MNNRRFWPALTAILLFLMILIWGLPILKQQVDFLQPDRTVKQYGKVNQVLLEKIYKEDRVVVYGSSELNTQFIPEHPNHMLTIEKVRFSPILIGAGGMQSLNDVLHIAAMERIGEKNQVLILSAQWFSKEGLSEDAFEHWFSPQEMYKMLNNPTISTGLKVDIAKRLLEFQSLKKQPLVYIVLWSFVASEGDLKWAFLPMTIDQWRLEWKTYLEAKRILKNRAEVALTNEWVSQGIDFAAELRNAEQLGNRQCTTNDFGVYDEYYKKHIQERLAEKRNADTNGTMTESPEYRDLELLLRVLKEQQAQALFVIVPVNGFWYDYTGFPASERQGYYQKVTGLLRTYSMPVADFSQHEYDKFFLADIMHVGWKGWCKINESIFKYHNSLSQ